MSTNIQNELYVEIRKALASKTKFPNTSVLADFSPESQTLHIKDIRAADLRRLFSEEPTVDFCQKAAILYHEITHWADMIGTLWGRSYLRRIYECHKILGGKSQPSDEYKYFKFIDLHDESRRFMLPKYYRILESASEGHTSADKWIAQLSAGREFDAYGKINNNKPILFVRFFSRERNELLVRQPVVAGALWEVNAVWSEMATNQETNSDLPSDIAVVEKYRAKKEFENIYFDKNLTLYSAPVHLLSYFAKLGNISDAYRLSSIISHCVLNLRSEHYKKIRPPTVMAPWKELFRGFSRCSNPAFAFAVICANAAAWQVGDNEYEWLDAALKKSGLPNSRQIFDDAQSTMEDNSSIQCPDSYDTALSYILSLGSQILKSRRSEVHPAITPSVVKKYNITTPGIFDEDGEIFDLPGSQFDYDKFDPMSMWDSDNKLFTWTQNFLDACRT